MATARTPVTEQFGQGVTYQGDSITLGDLADAGYTMVGNQAYDSDGNPVSLVPEDMNQRMTPKGIFRKLVIPVLLLAVGGFLISKKKTRAAGYVIGGLGAFTGIMALIKE